jgi:CIC family chloride channel protein
MIRHWLDRLQSSETVILSGLALIVGLTTGAGVWLFKRLIDLVHQLAFTNFENLLTPLGGWAVVVVPIVGGLVVGLMLHAFIGEERHHGVAGIMEAVALAGGRLRYQRVPAKAIASALAIGSGASIGPEDPSVQIGASLGSMFAQWLSLSDDRMRALAAAGAASGIAAAFNAPIAGVFFALEIVLGEISGSAFGLVVISSVLSAVFTQAVSGPEPAFHVPTYAFNSAWELPLYLVLGLFAGLVAALYIRSLYTAQDFFHQGLRLPRWIKPAIGGLAVGLVGRFLPQIFGVGYDTIEKILGGESLGVMVLLALTLAKILLTSTSIGAGFPGGVFAPALFIGATLGAALGQFAGQVFPGLNIVPAAFAMVGMAAVLAGAVHAPLTAIILLFEMTHDYRIILPVMFAVVVSMLIAQSLQRDSVYTLGLARKGIRLERGRDVEVLERVTVGEVMQPAPFTLDESDTLARAADLFQETRHHGVPVLNKQGELIGVFTLQDLDDIPADEWRDRRVGEACTHELLVAYPDESIGIALRRMGARDVGRLPVVARDNPRQLLGLLRRSDLVRAYDAALTRRAAMRHRAQQVRLGSLRGDEVSVLEVTIEPGAPCIDKLVKEVPWPRDCVIASLRRGRRLLIPHGDTRLQDGDVLMIVAEGTARQEVLRLVKDSRETSSLTRE